MPVTPLATDIPPRARLTLAVRRARRTLVLALAGVSSVATAAGAQRGDATPVVAATDRVYRDIERLLAAGLLADVMMGQRPFSVAEVARLARFGENALTAVRAAVDDPRSSASARAAAHARLRQLAWADQAVQQLATSGRIARLDRGRVQLRAGGGADLLLLHSTSPARAIPYLGLGVSDAIIASAAEHRSGLVVGRGEIAVGELGGWVGLGPVAIAGRGRGIVEAEGTRHGGNTGNAGIHTASARLLWGNAVVSVGREQLHWAQPAVGGLALSTSARPLGQLSIGMERPGRLPWFFAHLGPARGTAFIASLGRRQNFTNARLSGYKLSLLPHPRVELGATMLSQWGGEGAPEMRGWDVLRDHVPFLTPGGGGRLQVSNKLAAVDWRIRLSHRSGLTVYGEAAIDDLDRERLVSGMRQDGAQLLGVYLPHVGGDGRWSITVDGRRTGLRFYNHHQFTSGFSADGAILGDPLGPNARAVSISGTRDIGSGGVRGQIHIAATAERRSMDRYQILYPPLDFVRLETRPAEDRQRLTVGWMGAPRDRLSLRLGVSGERITGFGGTAGDQRWAAMSEAALSLGF